MNTEQRTKLYQQRDALLASLNYADEEEAEKIKQLINQINERLAEDDDLNKVNKPKKE